MVTKVGDPADKLPTSEERVIGRRMKSGYRNRMEQGFTLLELMIVISIIVILMSISIPQYQKSILHAREAVLKQDLYVLRSAIDQYTLDKQKAPQSLDELSQSGYLKIIPKDPFTNKNDSWVTVNEDSIMAVDQQQPGISDVHSGATQSSDDGTPYSEW